MNNEPVAYINVEDRKLEWAKPMTWHTPTIAQMDKIPLYTHPAKTLTTEEIKEIAIQHIEKRLDGDRFGYFEFASAVLKKAQEGNNAKS
jgi:hypothetical protein